MSSTHVQLWLIALAIIAYALFTLGLRWQSRSDRSRRVIGAIAALLCLAAPTATALLGHGDRPAALVPSLQFAAVGLCALALYALLRSSSRARIADLYCSAAASIRSSEKAATHPVSETATVAHLDIGCAPGLYPDGPEPRPAEVLEPASDQPVDPRNAQSGATVAIDADRVGDSALDLDETERLFRSLRRDADPIDLPDRSSWTDMIAARTTLGELMPDDAGMLAKLSAFDEAIEAIEAEVVLEPEKPGSPVDEEGVGGSPAGGVRLDGVLRDARNRGNRLELQVARLQQDHEEESARAARDARALARRETESARLLHRADRLVHAERQARVAAEELVDSQRGLIEELQQDVQRLQQRSRTRCIPRSSSAGE